MDFLKTITDFITLTSTIIPLEHFVIIGSFIEEIIAPLPSPLIMTISGSITKVQEQPLLFITWLALLGAIGKTLGAWILYMTAANIENLFTGKIGKLLLLSKEETELISNKMNKGWKNYFVLFAARATPVIPSAPLSIACGLIKLSIVYYLIATFSGTIIRNLLFLYFGYTGISNYQYVVRGIETSETFIQIAIFIALIIFISWFYYHHLKFKKQIR